METIVQSDVRPIELEKIDASDSNPHAEFADLAPLNEKGALEAVEIKLSRREWRALVRGIRRNKQHGDELVLGRLGWAVIKHIEDSL